MQTMHGSPYDKNAKLNHMQTVHGSPYGKNAKEN